MGAELRAHLRVDRGRRTRLGRIHAQPPGEAREALGAALCPRVATAGARLRASLASRLACLRARFASRLACFAPFFAGTFARLRRLFAQLLARLAGRLAVTALDGLADLGASLTACFAHLGPRFAAGAPRLACLFARLAASFARLAAGLSLLLPTRTRLGVGQGGAEDQDRRGPER
ncbi:MAG TPA: hypothetical protein DEF51_27345 [Myxococcales bacterium]|nr:hypothetical protein [Myxococcales bacterium]